MYRNERSIRRSQSCITDQNIASQTLLMENWENPVATLVSQKKTWEEFIRQKSCFRQYLSAFIHIQIT